MATTRALYQQAVTYQKRVAFTRRKDVWTCKRQTARSGLRESSSPEVAGVLENRSHPATSLLKRKVIKDLLARPLGTTSSLPERAGLERARSISAWVKDYGVVLDL